MVGVQVNIGSEKLKLDMYHICILNFNTPSPNRSSRRGSMRRINSNDKKN